MPPTDPLPMQCRSRNLFHRAYAVLGIILLITACTRYVAPNYAVQPLPSGTSHVLQADSSFVSYRIDAANKSVLNGSFRTFDARLDFDPADLLSLKLEAAIDLGSIDVGDADVEDQLRSSRWLNIQRFPVARFRTDSVEVLSSDSFLLNGQLNLHGTSRPLTLDARFIGGATNLMTGQYTLAFTATASLDRSSFGLSGLRELASNVVSLQLYGEFVANQLDASGR